MYQKERLNEILEIVKKYGYITVKYLVGALHYSNATINRDLNLLEKQGKIARSYGGVELVEGSSGVPLPFRYHKMHAEKLKIAKRASEMVKDGDTLFIDASTTTELMAEFLKEKKDLTVITNNVSLVTTLSEYGVEVICLGGTVVEKPCMLGGNDTVDNARKYRADKAFLASCCVFSSGRIGITDNYELLQKAMLDNSEEAYYLADSDKVDNDKLVTKYLCDLGRLKGIISDYDFPNETKEKFPKTQFIKV
jgi:DeoR family myo-inositol catabolism operon transcriptional repressor